MECFVEGCGGYGQFRFCGIWLCYQHTQEISIALVSAEGSPSTVADHPDCYQCRDLNPIEAALVKAVADLRYLITRQAENTFIEMMNATVRTPGAARAAAIYRDALEGGARAR